MLNITEAILNRRSTYDIVEADYIKNQIMYNGKDAEYFNSKSLYRDNQTLIFDFDNLDNVRNNVVEIKNAEFTEIIEEFDINKILFKGNGIKKFRMYCEFGDFSNIILENQSNITIDLLEVGNAKLLKGDIFIQQDNNFRFDKPKSDYFHIRLKDYYYTVEVGLDFDLSKKLKPMSPSEKLKYLEDTYGIPEKILFNLYSADLYFIKGISNPKELGKYKLLFDFKKITQHPDIPDLNYFIQK